MTDDDDDLSLTKRRIIIKHNSEAKLTSGIMIRFDDISLAVSY
jgi:hypothetical protein